MGASIKVTWLQRKNHWQKISAKTLTEEDACQHENCQRDVRQNLDWEPDAPLRTIVHFIDNAIPSLRENTKKKKKAPGRCRILEYSGFEGIFKGHLVQLLSKWAGTSSTRSGYSEPHPTWLECFQGWGIQHPSGKCVPVFHHPHCEKFQ